MNELSKFLIVLLINTFLFFTCTTKTTDTILDNKIEEAMSEVSEVGDYRSYILPESDDFAAIPQDPKNPLTAEKIELGKFLFFESCFSLNASHESGKKTWSCATCHVPTAGFMPGRAQGIADGGQGFGINGEGRAIRPDYAETEVDVQSVRTLSQLNSAFVSNSTSSGMFGVYGVNKGTEEYWDDDPMTEVNFFGYDGLESQNIAGQTLHRMQIDPQTIEDCGYKEHYDTAFPDFPEDERYGAITTSLALSAYLRSLLTTEAPFQKWLKGDKQAMTEQQKRGALLFFDKAQCAQCHNGTSLNAVEFHALGVKDLHQGNDVLNPSPNDRRVFGRGGFTGKQEDMYKFKVPQLYNMKDSPFYFHGSSKRSMREVVEYFNNAIPENPVVPEEQISLRFKPLFLTEDEIDDLVEFVNEALYDDQLSRYFPTELPSGHCFPNNDSLSRIDLGCY